MVFRSGYNKGRSESGIVGFLERVLVRIKSGSDSLITGLSLRSQHRARVRQKGAGSFLLLQQR